MLYTFIPLKSFMQKYQTLHPKPENIESFVQHLTTYFSRLADSRHSRTSAEEFEKNILRDLLQNTFAYNTNTRDKIDLAIYEDNAPKVIFECKSLTNKNEFINGGGGK
ncbi:MAG: hypothetical protein J1E28_04400 [Helicobacter sp.]|uniref:DUF7149 domain-containing protein n=1 Tax=Helicobacter sp. TaxID=218 RepID=UPI0025B97A80|nr:hypothetical protein [Helicobacter sp.]MCH5313623.1 hypothetical protein [Helicobacter sp.]